MNSESSMPPNVGSNDQLGAGAEARCICKDRAANEREALDAALGLWVCPWRICNTKQAQECRAATGGGKHQRGCGAQFSRGTTLEQARGQIGGLPKSRA